MSSHTLPTPHCSLLDPLLESFKTATHLSGAAAPSAQQMAVVEGQLAWLVSVIASVLRGRLSAGAAESQEAVDGDLAARVFELLTLADSGSHQARYAHGSRQRLDMALLSFFQAFRKVFIGEQVGAGGRARGVGRAVLSGGRAYRRPSSPSALTSAACGPSGR